MCVSVLCALAMLRVNQERETREPENRCIYIHICVLYCYRFLLCSTHNGLVCGNEEKRIVRTLRFYQ